MSRHDCAECERVSKYMSADPEMYRGESHKCSAHRRIEELEQDIAALEERDLKQLERAEELEARLAEAEKEIERLRDGLMQGVPYKAIDAAREGE